MKLRKEFGTGKKVVFCCDECPMDIVKVDLSTGEADKYDAYYQEWVNYQTDNNPKIINYFERKGYQDFNKIIPNHMCYQC